MCFTGGPFTRPIQTCRVRARPHRHPPPHPCRRTLQLNPFGKLFKRLKLGRTTTLDYEMRHIAGWSSSSWKVLGGLPCLGAG